MSYAEAKKEYAKYGVDTDKAIETAKNVPVALHCWQGDDVRGFEGAGSLSGGIQTTGNYPGAARNPEELFCDFEKALSLCPGKKKINVHACYGIYDKKKFDRDSIKPEHFKAWVDFAKKHDCGIDFNPTYFSHDMVKDNLTLTSPDEKVRNFFIEHGKRCLEIAEYFATETGIPCVMNIWIPDGLKDVPASRMAMRERYMDSLDKILAHKYDKKKVLVAVESKVFGIGLESYTAGSAEFCTMYAISRGILPLFDNGHYHPTESVADKISAALLFSDKLALHVTRGVRWDSDHVVLFDDETREIMKEVVRCNALDRVAIATDYFDASINRISAWVTGQRSVEKALLYALLEPSADFKKLQDEADFTALMARQEDLKLLPFGEVWREYLRQENVVEDYVAEVKKYEEEVLSKR